MSADLTGIAGTIDQYRDILAQIKELQAAADLLKNDIIDALAGEQTGSIGDTIVVKHSVYESSRFDSIAFKAAHPDVAKKFTKTVETSRLSLVDETR